MINVGFVGCSLIAGKCIKIEVNLDFEYGVLCYGSALQYFSPSSIQDVDWLAYQPDALYCPSLWVYCEE